MSDIQAVDLPADALLNEYRRKGAYTDCYVAALPGRFSQEAYVEAFYTTGLFRVERLILAVLARKPSTDGEARRIARGESDRFAAWHVEGRTPNQLLMCDFMHRTRSWLMSVPDGQGGTRLFFGSAVVPEVDERSGQASMGWHFKALLGFHHAYSRALLKAACARLSHGR
jgi:hypothetical protein